MSWVMVDVESDGPYPGGYSMICFGAVIVERGLNKSFYAELCPMSEEWIPEALAVSGFTREETFDFPDPALSMANFDDWLSEYSKGRPYFISDNNGYDWQFINYYFWRFLGKNPFGFSSTNLGSLYKGIVKDMRKNFKHLRTEKHTHNPVDDARGNAGALLTLIERGFRMKL